MSPILPVGRQVAIGRAPHDIDLQKLNQGAETGIHIFHISFP
jgi:hypothetical protein